ncbi:MAG: ABC transporter permease [Clostridiaceae bacterium]
MAEEKIVAAELKVNLDKPIKKKKKKKSQWVDVWRRLRVNKMAMLGLFILVVLILTAIFADVIAPEGYDNQVLKDRLLPPSLKYFFGTDNFGRSIFSRVVHGSRISLIIGFISVSIAAIIGGTIGAIAGYYSGKLDNILMRLIDILLAIPSILLAISIVASLGPGLRNVMIAVGIGSVPSYARIVRASVMSYRDQEFVEAARAVGASDFRIILKHIIPNTIAPIIVQATLGVAGAILSAAGLSFIGLGIELPTPEWGAMLSGGRDYLRDNWYVATFPGLAIMITILSLNLLGDGLRDALDPRLKN